MKKITVLILFLLCAIISFGRSRVICGHIFNENLTKVVPYARITVNDKNIISYSDSLGFFILEIPKKENIKLNISHFCYKTTLIDVPNNIDTFDIVIETFYLNAGLLNLNKYSKENLPYPDKIFPYTDTLTPDTNFTVVENPAMFKGGREYFLNYLALNLGSIDSNISNEKEQTVDIYFTIDINGKCKEIKIAENKLDKTFSEKIIWLLTKMPKWEPAIYMGNRVEQYFVLQLQY